MVTTSRPERNFCGPLGRDPTIDRDPGDAADHHTEEVRAPRSKGPARDTVGGARALDQRPRWGSGLRFVRPALSSLSTGSSSQILTRLQSCLLREVMADYNTLPDPLYLDEIKIKLSRRKHHHQDGRSRHAKEKHRDLALVKNRITKISNHFLGSRMQPCPSPSNTAPTARPPASTALEGEMPWFRKNAIQG